MKAAQPQPIKPPLASPSQQKQTAPPPIVTANKPSAIDADLARAIAAHKQQQDAKRQQEQTKKQEAATARRMATPTAAPTPSVKAVAQPLVKGVVKLGDVVANTLEGVLDFLVGAPPPREISPAEYMRDTKARQEHHRQKAAEAKREIAIEQIIEDKQSGRDLSLTDFARLSREDAEQIKARGVDDWIKQQIQTAERKRERDRDRAYERQR
jgi:hypothetical protein